MVKTLTYLFDLIDSAEQRLYFRADSKYHSFIWEDELIQNALIEASQKKGLDIKIITDDKSILPSELYSKIITGKNKIKVWDNTEKKEVEKEVNIFEYLSKKDADAIMISDRNLLCINQVPSKTNGYNKKIPNSIYIQNWTELSNEMSEKNYNGIQLDKLKKSLFSKNR